MIWLVAIVVILFLFPDLFDLILAVGLLAGIVALYLSAIGIFLFSVFYVFTEVL